MHFLRRLRPLEVMGEHIRILRVSLNTPVLSTPDLPIGPARAMVVVHREPRGRMDATIGVRSLRGSEVAYWSFDGQLSNDSDLDVAGDAALSFAESLGFLFDEAPMGPGAEAGKEFRRWLTGERDGTAALRLSPEEKVDDLFDASEPFDLPLEELLAEEEPTSPQTAQISPPAPPLSKFRARGEAPPPRAPGAAKQPLARVQLVKRRSPEEERKRLLRKLLTSF
jgi:hypothetical protein